MELSIGKLEMCLIGLSACGTGQHLKRQGIARPQPSNEIQRPFDKRDHPAIFIAAASEFTGPGFLLPTRNYEVFAWCLANGLRLQFPTTLMTTGLYNEPAGAYLACILY